MKRIIGCVRKESRKVYKGGNPYILHLLRVMFSRKTEIERICAVLHDVIEDTDITLDYLRKEGFSEEVISAIDALTKRNGESYDEFIDFVENNNWSFGGGIGSFYL